MLVPQKIKSEKKPQARGFNPHAMAQAQALNQQPDSIPAMMKPGEYVLPPDTVAAMGGPGALDATVAQTHTPANAGAIVPQGFEPRLFFSSGGLAQDEEQNPKPISPTNIYPQGSPSAGANVYGGAIDAAKSAVSAAANPQGGQPLVKGAAQMFGQREELQQQGRERWDASVAARQPAPTQPAQPVGLPAAAAAPTPRAQFVADQNQKLAAANTQLAERTAQLNERYKPAPNSPTNTFPANRMPVENVQPQQAPTAPAVTSGFASAQDGMTNDFGRQPSSPTPMAAAAPSTAQKTPASDPQSRINEQIANAQRQRAEGIAAVQRGQAYDSTARQQLGPQSTADTGPTSFTGDVLRTAGQDAQAAWQRGGAEGVGAAAGALVRGSMATPGAIAVDAVDSVVNGPIGQGIGGFARGLFGGAGQQPASAAPAQKSSAGSTGAAAPERTPEQLAKQLGGLDRQHAQNVQLQAAARTPEQARAEVQQTEGLAQVRGLPGVYQHGRGQYSDNPEGMGFATGFTGQPSAQNMQAANALASQQQAQSMGRIAMQQQAQQQMQQPRGFAAPQIDHSGNSSASKDELRRLRWAAESAMANAPRKKYAMQHPAVMAYQAALQGDTAARYGGQAGLEAKTNDTNASLQREQMQQQGANQRDAGRLYLDQQRVGMEATTKGFDVRQAQRKENAQLAWEKASPEQRSVIKERYPDLFGNEDKKKPYSFDVVRGSSDPVTGRREGDYAFVFDPNTGQHLQVQIGGGAAVPTAAPQEASKSVL